MISFFIDIVALGLLWEELAFTELILNGSLGMFIVYVSTSSVCSSKWWRKFPFWVESDLEDCVYLDQRNVEFLRRLQTDQCEIF